MISINNLFYEVNDKLKTAAKTAAKASGIAGIAALAGKLGYDKHESDQNHRGIVKPLVKLLRTSRKHSLDSKVSDELDYNDNKYRVYKCDSEASEYKGWVIKLDLTTPVKF